MFLLEYLSDVFLPDRIDWQRDRVVFNRRNRRRHPFNYSWLVLAIPAVLIVWLVIGAMFPDPHLTLYNTSRPNPPEIAEIAHLGDLLAASRRSGDNSPAARAARTVLYKRLHLLEIQSGKDFTR